MRHVMVELDANVAAISQAHADKIASEHRLEGHLNAARRARALVESHSYAV